MSKFKNRHNGLLALFFTGILSLVIALGPVLQVSAIARFSGLEQIISDNSEENPFTIVELVPDHQYDTLGFLVEGEEPIDWYAQLDTRTTLKDRQIYVTDLMLRLNPILSSTADMTPMQASALYSEYYNEKIMLASGDNPDEWHKIEFDEPVEEERVGGFQPAQGGDYTRHENTVPESDEEGNVSNRVVGYSYEYTPGAGNYTWVDNPSGETQTITYQQVYCKLDIKNNDWLKTKIFQLDADEEFFIDIISVTPAELEQQLGDGTLNMETVDFLYVSDSTFVDKAYFDAHLPKDEESDEADESLTSDTTPIELQPYSEDNDISESTVNIIKEYVQNTELAVALDYRFWRDSLTSDGEELTETNLYRVYTEIAEVYAKLPKNAEDTGTGVDADGNFVASSVFVVNIH